MYLLLLKLEIVIKDYDYMTVSDWRRFASYEEAKAELEKLQDPHRCWNTFGDYQIRKVLESIIFPVAQYKD